MDPPVACTLEGSERDQRVARVRTLLSHASNAERAARALLEGWTRTGVRRRPAAALAP